MSVATYESNGQRFDVSEDRLEEFLKLHPNAKKVTGETITEPSKEGYETYYNREGDEWKPYDVSYDRLEDFKSQFPEAKTEQGWKDFAEQQEREIKAYNKRIADAKSEAEKKRLEAEQKEAQRREDLQSKNKEKILSRFEKEIEEQHPRYTFRRKYKLEDLRALSYEDKVKWLNENTQDNFDSQLSFEPLTFDVDKNVVDETKLDIPDKINILGVETSQPENAGIAEIGNNYLEEIKEYNSSLQNILSNPIMKDGKVDYEATQEAINNIESNAPSGIDLKNGDWTENEINTALAEIDKRLADLPEYQEGFKEENDQREEILKEAYRKEMNAFMDEGGPDPGMYDEWRKKNIDNPAYSSFSLTLDVDRTQNRRNIENQVTEEVFNELLEERRIKLEQYNKGEIDLSMDELSQIASVDRQMMDYMARFMPSSDEIVEMEDPELGDSENVINAMNAATNAAVLADPRFNLIQENIVKQVDAESAAKIEELRAKYKLNEGITEEKLIAVENDFKEWYSNTIGERIKENKVVKRIYQEYGLATGNSFNKVMQDYQRYKDPFLRKIDDTLARYEDDDGIRATLKKYSAKIRETAVALPTKNATWWNEFQIGVQNDFFLKPGIEKLNNLEENMKKFSLTADTTVGEARKLFDFSTGIISEESGGSMDDMTLGMVIKDLKDHTDYWEDSIKVDVDEMLDAYEDMFKYKSYSGESDKGVLTLEGFLDRVVGLVDQAPHMVPSLLGKGFVFGGTLASATGIGASVGAPAVVFGTSLIGASSVIQGIMSYGDVYMGGVRRGLEKELGREATAEEYLEALKNSDKYTSGVAAATAAGLTVGTEFLSDYITSRLTGSVGSAFATNTIGKAIMGNALTKYFATVGSSYLGMKVNAAQEYFTEGFQEYIGQIANQYIDKFVQEQPDMQDKSIFTPEWDTILESAKMGYRQGELFGGVALIGATVGINQNQTQKNYIQQAEDIGYSIDMNPTSETYTAANQAFEQLQKNINANENLTTDEKRNQIKEISRIREAAILVPSNVKGLDKNNLMKLLIEQKQLKNEIKSVDNKELSVNKIERLAQVDQQIVDIIQRADSMQDVVQSNILGPIQRGLEKASGTQFVVDPTQEVSPFAENKQEKDSYQKIDDLIAKEDLDLNNRFDQKRILQLAGGTIRSAFNRLYQEGGLLTRKQFQTRLENEYIQALTEYKAEQDVNNQGIGQQTSNLFGLRANAVASENIKQQGDTVSISDPKAQQVADTDTIQQTDFDQLEQQEKLGKREKKYMAENKKVVKAVGKEAVSQIDKETSQEILREANIGEGAESIAGSIANAFGQIKARGGRGLFNIIGKKIGTLNSQQYKNFVDNNVDRDFIAALPAAYLKQSSRLQEILGLKKIGQTQVVKTDKDGKKTYSRPTVFAIPSEITDKQVQEVREYFKSSPTAREGLLKRLSQEFALDSIEKLKNNKDFMQKLQTALGSEQNALDFLNEIQAKLDQRTLEDTTRDITVDSPTMDKIIELIDKGIEIITPEKGTMKFSLIPGGQQAAVYFLKMLKQGLAKGTQSFYQARSFAIRQLQKAIAITKKQKDIIKNIISKITAQDLNDTKFIKQQLDNVETLVNKDKYLNVSDHYIKAFKKIRSKQGRINFLKSFFKDVNTSFQKADVKTRGLYDGQNAESSYNYWQEQFGVNLSELGFTLIKSGPKGKTIAFEGNPVVTAGSARPSNIKSSIENSYKSKGFQAARETVLKNIDKSNLNAQQAKDYLVNEIVKLVEQGNADVAIQLLDIMGLSSDSTLRMAGTIRSIQDNVTDYITTDKKGKKKNNGKALEYEHTPSISTLRDKIKNAVRKPQSIQSLKKQLTEILDDSFVDIIGKNEARKLDELGRRTSGEGIARYDGVVNAKNLIMIEAGPQELVSDKKAAIDKISKEASTIVKKEDSPKKVKKTLLNSLKTRVQALKINKKRKGLSAFDMDDTLALTKEKVIYTLDGKKSELTAAEFAVQYETLLEQGAEFDFSNFDNVDLSTPKGPLAGTALRRQAKYGPKDIYIVTARPKASQQAIKLWADSIGLNIPIENIITLEDGSPQVKADWLLSRAEEGYNDFYFADDSALNVQTVKDILSQIDVKSNVQQAITDKATRLDQEMNEIIEDATGIAALSEVSDVQARIEGKRRDKGFLKRVLRQFKITASADDFLGLGYYLFGKGEKGTRQQKWFIKNLIEPYNKAEQELISAKIAVANDFSALKKAFPSLRNKGIKGLLSNPLNQEVGYGPYTKSQAVRVYLWNKQGMEIPGMSQADIDGLSNAVATDFELQQFADNIQLIQKSEQYPGPTANWLAGDIKSDILQGLDKTFRAEALTEWNENVDIIFSDKNKNKLEKAFGSKYIEALEDSIKRMRSGSNRPTYTGSGARQVNEMMDWLNSSVGVAMFLNMRSGSLQMLSNVNFINWGDNNIYAAAKAFASKDYVPTVIKLMNSDYLVNRRDGLKINVNEAELAAAANKGGFKGMLNYLLDKGFILTRIFDTLAIATGGATFYINRVKSLQNRVNPATNKIYTLAEAEVKAFDDFYAIAEETQQSSNPSKISSQQASLFGRTILSYQNVTMQYNRKTKKSLLDLVNRRRKPGMTQRESDLSNLSSVIYYVAVQNLIFNSLQQALFALAFDEEDEKEKDKVANTINGMMDSLLFGLGFGGAIISTVKNVALKLLSESERKTPEYEEAVWSLFDISPVLDQKVRNIRTALRTFSWNRKEMKKRGWSLENPAYLAIAQLISATLNIPIDRALRKYNNINQAFDEEVKTYERIALLLGWNGWNFGLPYWGRESTIKQEAADEEKLKEKFKASVKKAKADGFTKRVPFTGSKSWSSGIPEGLKEGVDYVAIERYDGIIQYYKKP